MASNTTTTDTAAAANANAIATAARKASACKGAPKPLSLREWVVRFLGALPASHAANVPEIRDALRESPYAERLATACEFGNPRIRQMVERMWRAGEVDRYDGNPSDGNGRACACYCLAAE
jgi:hypothetical protein